MFIESQSEKNMEKIIPQSVKDLHKLFQQKGKKLFVVGGAVRDFLTHDIPKDFDLCTDALPDEVLDIIGDKYETNLQGKAFGVVVVYTDDQPEGMEIATFRQDTSKGRNPTVKLGVGIEDDVKRRDITFNSLFYDLDKREIVDLTGGIKDLELGVTKMVGDAIERFDEDSLRILRAFRFSSRYGFALDKETAQAIRKRPQLENMDPETNKVKRISAERIWGEITKAWKQAKSFDEYLNFFTEFDMWNEVFPNSTINVDVKKTDTFVCYIANLFKDDNRVGLEKIMLQDYKIPYDVVYKVLFLKNLLKLSPLNVFDLYKEKIKSNCGDDTIIEWKNLKQLDENLINKFLVYKPTVSAEELMKKGFKGKQLGEEIKRCETEKFLEL